MIQLNHIHLTLPGFALRDINLHIQKKDFFALIGPTGSGKSLLLEGMMGLVPFTGGTMVMGNRDISGHAVEKRDLAIVYQDFALFPHLDVTQNIFYGVPFHGISRKKAGERFDMLVSTLGLEKITKRKTHNLSGGEKQRVALARSLILNPGVLLLDEPLSALDPIFHGGAKRLLKKIHREMDMTIVMVSHNFNDVMDLANRGAIIRGGRIIQQGATLSIFEKPNSRFTADFVGMKNITPIQIRDGKIIVETNDIKIKPAVSPGAGHRYMGIRPEDVVLNTLGNNIYDNFFQGQIQSIVSNGVFLTISLETSNFVFQAIWPRSYLKDYGLGIGKRVEFGFHGVAVHTFRASNKA